jgi:hypothetical protein
VSIQVKVSGNFSTINLQEMIENKAEEELKERYIEVAKGLIAYSPLGHLGGTTGPNGKYATGAYISSHTVQFNSSSRGSGKSSKKRSRGSLNGSSSLAGMIERIAVADFDQLKNTTFRNDSPHAQVVEYGGVNWSRSGYYVYEQAAQRINTASRSGL